MLENSLSALIKGNKVSMQTALKKLKSIITDAKGIHIDGLSCDMEALDEIFLFAEKRNASVDHMHGENISKFNFSFQRLGGNITSYNEVKKRSDFILLIGLNEDSISSDFMKQILNEESNLIKRRDIHFITEQPKKKSRHSYIKVNKGDLEKKILKLKDCIINSFDGEKNLNNKDFSLIIKSLNKSRYGTIIFKSQNLSDFLISEIIDLVKILSEFKKFNFLHYLGGDNVAGAVQASLWKTGFPLRINFTENGPEYNPLENNSSYLKKKKELQIYVSCFEENPKINFFSQNVFIGNPNLKNKNLFDIFIPSLTPGINQNGLIVRGDGVCREKLKKKKNSELNSVKQIFSFCKA